MLTKKNTNLDLSLLFIVTVTLISCEMISGGGGQSTGK